MTGESASQANPPTGSDQPLTSNSMVQTIHDHKVKLEEIRNKLQPSKLGEVTDTTVKETFLPDIISVFTYIENVERSGDLFKYITDTNSLQNKLNEIILVLYDALDAWEMSLKKVDDTVEELKARSSYRKHLNMCYGLLKEALNFFTQDQQVQQGSNPRGNSKSSIKKP